MPYIESSTSQGGAQSFALRNAWKCDNACGRFLSSTRIYEGMYRHTYTEQLGVANDAALQLKRGRLDSNIDATLGEAALTVLVASGCTPDYMCKYKTTRRNLAPKISIYERDALELSLTEDCRLLRVQNAYEAIQPTLNSAIVDSKDIITTVAELVPGVHASMNTPFMQLGADSDTCRD